MFIIDPEDTGFIAVEDHELTVFLDIATGRFGIHNLSPESLGNRPPPLARTFLLNLGTLRVILRPKGDLRHLSYPYGEKMRLHGYVRK